jgi:outer membrane protein assembly factor BamD (BamD/ComL family)
MNRKNHYREINPLFVKHSRSFLQAAMFVLLFFLGGCAAMQESLKGSETKPPEIDPLARAKGLFNEGNYDAAVKENQKLLTERKMVPDMALFNMGLIYAYSLNPKKDYPTALGYFKTIVTQYPRSSMFEQSKAWVQILEEHQKLAEERQKLAEEKRLFIRERDALAQERERLKQAVEMSRRLDIEIDKRRRKMQSK